MTSTRSRPLAPPSLRADALRNRDRILAAARALFAVHGVDVPMAEVARRAGVGAATLHRRFPTRESLVSAVFADRLATCDATIDAALADPDPWHALCTVVDGLVTAQAEDRGFTAALLSTAPDIAVERVRTHIEEGLEALVERARTSGRLRDDVELSDVMILLLAVGGVASARADLAPAASRRLVGHLLRAFANPDTSTASAPLPAAPSLALADVLDARRITATPPASRAPDG